MIESFDSFKKIKHSKSMTSLTPSYIDTKIVNQIGNYTLGIELGSGAFGKVVLGKHIITGESVAIKILDKEILKKTPDNYELVKKEMSILKLVKHKYIIQLYEILQTPKYIFIVMEYCEGKDFMDYILSKNYLPESEALKYFQQLINALFYLHSQNIAHRDIKIDNILLDYNKNLKLIDFGLSTKYKENKLLDQPCGTIVYSAPEVLEGKLYHGMLADIWSCGIVLYGMLFGYLPFSEEDDSINKKNIIEGKYQIPDNISNCAKNLLKHMLDINPMTRYTLKEIKEHPWFKMNNFCLIQGIIIGYHKIPVDEDVLDLCEKFNYDRNKIKFSVENNKFDEGSALYYLLVKQRYKKGIYSVSDLFSEKFIKYIYNEKNLIISINNLKLKNENLKNDINERIRKTESNLSAAPGLALGIISTPKKIKKYKFVINDKNLENEKNEELSELKHKILKKNKKIKLYSCINKKSLSKIQKSNNFVSNFLEEKNYISNTSNLCQNKKIKNKITKNNNLEENKNDNYENNNSKNKIKNNKNSKNNHPPFIHNKIIMDNTHKTLKKENNKENHNLNQQLSIKEIFINKISEKHYSITSNSQITKKSKNRIDSNSNKNYSKINPISILKNSSVLKNENHKNKLIKSNCKTNLRHNKDYSTINIEKISKSIDTIKYNLQLKHQNKSFEKINNNYKYEIKHKNELSKKNIKNTSPINKIIKSNINYFSNYLSNANSKEKRNIIKINKPQIRIDRNEGYSTNYTNYTKSSSHSSNAINKNKQRISTNAFNLCRKAKINNFNVYRKPSNLKKNIIINNENISNLILDKIDKNQINKSSNKFPQHEETKNKNICNNIKLNQINKLEKLKKSSKYLYINNKILKGLKYKGHNKNINQSKTLYGNYKKDINAYSSIAPSVKKYKNRINFSTSNEKNIDSRIKIGKKNSENISLIKVNQKSKSNGKNLTSPNKYKIKQKIKNNNDICKNKNNMSKKRYFGSTVITRRYKSPIVIRQLSESQNKNYLNKKSRNKKTSLMLVDKIILGEKENKTNISNSKMNPFNLNNTKIKNKAKHIKNKTPLKIITNINLNSNKSSLLFKKSKNNSKKNIIPKNHKTQINPCYSKENIYFAPNLLYKINSPKNQNMKHKYQEIYKKNNHSINMFDTKSYPLIKSLKNKCNNNSNKKIYHRNVNHFNISNTNNTNLTNNNYFSNYSISTSLSMNSIAVIKDKVKAINTIINPCVLDLSCILFGKKNLNECCDYLINRLKKYGYNYSQKNLNFFDCYKNGDHCQIEILQIFSEDNFYNIKSNCNEINFLENENNPIFYFKISKKKGNKNFLKNFF